MAKGEPLTAPTCGPLQQRPPLSFDSSSFDFAWAISVFTHLAGNSAQWLLELHRVLRPGGLLMASYMGRWTSEALAEEIWDEDQIGLNELYVNRPWDEGGPMVFMSDWWVEEHWGRAFEIVASNQLFHGQTWVMLRKKNVEITPGELLEPSGDPREYAALRHNIAQRQAEVDRLETSWSWRVTRPLRHLRRVLRGRRQGEQANS